MAKHLKRGMDASAIKAADAKVRETVEQILADIEARKDVAVRELSQKFDNWSPTSFKLAPSEVERAIGQVRKRDLDDIRFAQAQVRNFAQKQRATLRDLVSVRNGPPVQRDRKAMSVRLLPLGLVVQALPGTAAPALRVVTGEKTVASGEDEPLISVVCSSGAT